LVTIAVFLRHPNNVAHIGLSAGPGVVIRKATLLPKQLFIEGGEVGQINFLKHLLNNNGYARRLSADNEGGKRKWLMI